MFKLFVGDNLEDVNAPEFPKELAWLNSKPLKLKELNAEKKTVLVDFWTYSCVNCLRTLPYLLHWYEKYEMSGLEIIGVHTPEFEFEKDILNIKNFLISRKIKYPVVVDSDKKIWDLYSNHVWPRKLLIDIEGRIRYDHSGEGSYSQTEEKIQELLIDTNQALKFNRVVPEIEHLGGGAVCYSATVETYAGFKRGVLGNPEGYFPNRKFEYSYRGEYTDGAVYLEGIWTAKEQYLEHSVSTKRNKDYLSLRFHGLEVNAVAKVGNNSTQEVLVTL